jgi:hypothetical protein
VKVSFRLDGQVAKKSCTATAMVQHAGGLSTPLLSNFEITDRCDTDTLTFS